VVRGVGKRFRKYDPNRSWTFQEWIASCFRPRSGPKYFWSLKDINFDLGRGSALGIVGANGAGKSTLLRLLAGISHPDEGRLHVYGRLSGLLSLGAGFHPDLTGRENVYVTGVIAGLNRKEVASRFDEIVEFAELGHAIDAPLRTYSSGMQMRLAFSVAIHVESEVLLIDEVLAVGDRAFQQKCLDRIKLLRQGGTTIVIVSHETLPLSELCDEVIWLEQGRVREHGRALDTLAHYLTAMEEINADRVRRETLRRTPAQHPALQVSTGTVLEVGQNRFGSMEIQAADIRVLDRNGAPSEEFQSGDPIHVVIEYHAPNPVHSPVFGLTLMDDGEKTVFSASTDSSGTSLATIHGRGVVRFEICPASIGCGSFFLNAGIYHEDWSYAYDHHWRVHELRIQESGGGNGNIGDRSSWGHETLTPSRSGFGKQS
jgi:lipopolysaccharide transport system ATP-binding protein